MLGKFKKKPLIALGGAMLVVSQVSLGATVHGAPQFAVEAVQNDATVVTIPAATFNIAVQTAVTAASTFTLTLGGDAKFNVAPASITCTSSSACGPFTVLSSTAKTVTYAVGASGIAADGVLTFGTIPLVSASALGTPNTCVGLAANSIGVSVSGGIVASGPIATSCNLTVTAIEAPATQNGLIDVATGATSFKVANSTTASYAFLGNFRTTLNPNPFYLSNGTLVAIGTNVNPKSSLTLTAGSLAGIESIKLVPKPSNVACPGYAPGAPNEQTGVIAGNTVSFSTPFATDLANTTQYCVYAQASGTSPMFAGSSTIPFSTTGSTTYVTTPANSLTPTAWAVPATLGSLTLDGSAASVDYVVGYSSIYNNYVAVTNPSFLPATVYGTMITYGLNGNPSGVATTGVVATIPPNGGVLLNSQQIADLTTGVLPSGEAARVFFFSNVDGLNASNMLLNGGSIVTGIQ